MRDTLLRVAERLGRVGGWRIDLGTRRITFSDEIRRVLDLGDDDEFDLDEVGDLYRPEWRGRVSDDVRRCATDGTPYEHEVEMELPSGRRIWVRGIGEAVRDDGTIVALRGAIIDVTTQKDAEMRLAEHTWLLRHTPDAVVVRSPDGTITFWNPGAERLYGIPASEAIGRHIDDVLDGFYRPDTADRDVKLARGMTWLQRRTVRRTDGTIGSVDLRLTPIPGPDGAPRAVMSIATDVTEQIDTRERLEAALEENGVGVWEFDLQDMITWRTPQHDRIFGHDEMLERWTAEDLFDHVVDEDRRRVYDAFLDALTTGRLDIDLRIRRADGVIRSVAIRASGVRDDLGRIDRLRGTIVDVSGRVELEERLAQAHKLEAVGRLTGGIAHDFNNLLTVISGSAELLQSVLAGDERAVPLATMIRDAAGRGADLTQRLLAVGRRQALRPRVVDASTAIRDAEVLLRRAIREHVALELDLTDADSPISVDPTQFEAALMNLCINASDAMTPAGGQLVIATSVVDDTDASEATLPDRCTGRHVRIVVTDDGSGMEREVLERAFEPFFSTKDVGRGAGLGLSMVYGFIQQSGGNVRIESTPGVGTSVTMCFPLAAGTVETVEEASAVPLLLLRGQGARVLVVEDDAPLRDLAVHLLTDLGYEVSAAADGPAALALLDAGLEIDVLFTDVVMPGGMTGPQLADRVHERLPDLPVVFTSGYVRDAVDEVASLDLLTKPYRRGELAVRLRRALDR